MANIEFSKEEKEIVVDKIKDYFEKELDQEIGQFDAEFLLDFFAKELGSYYYNRGLYDAQAILETITDNLKDAIYNLEIPTKFMRN